MHTTPTTLLTIGNPKTEKGRGLGYLTAILHLAPHDVAERGRSVCPYASPACIASCLNTAGRGGIFAKGATTNAIQEARKRRTRLFWSDRSEFEAKLLIELRAFVRLAQRHALRPALRLNGTSDLDWSRLMPNVVREAQRLGVTLYDYTKNPNRACEAMLAREYAPGSLKAAVHHTFSRSERTTDQAVRDAIASGVNVAVVFARGVDAAAIARARWGADVVDGDAHDLRFLDPRGVVVALTAKGRARKDTSGFVVRG